MDVKPLAEALRAEDDRRTVAVAARAAKTQLSAEDAAKLEADKQLLDSLPFGAFVEASGQMFVISAYKGRRWLYRVPKLLSFKKRQKIASRARKAAREEGLMK